MTKIEKLYHEITRLTPTNLKDKVSDRLDLILRKYVKDLDEAQNSLLASQSNEEIYKELSK